MTDTDLLLPSTLPDLTGLPDPEGEKLDADPVAPAAAGFVAAPVSPDRALLDRHVAWLRTQIGRTESPAGSNHVRLFLAGQERDLWGYVRPDFQGQPWCAGIQTGGLLQLGVDLRLLFSNGNSFYCPTLESMAKARGVWRTGDYSPRPGDLSLMDDRHTGHATHVEASAPDSSRYAGYRQIGGNTSPGNRGSQNNGGGVWLRDRSRSAIRGWIDMEALLGQMRAEGMITGPQVAKQWTAPAGTSVSLAAVQRAASLDGPRPDGGTTPGSAVDVRVVEQALHAEGLLAEGLVDGSFGTSTVAAYRAWQTRLGYRGADADGIPGRDSLARLGSAHGFTVNA